MQISSRQIFGHVIRRSQSSRSQFPPNFLQSRNEFFGFFEIKNQFVFFFFKWKLFFFLNFKFRVFNFFLKKKNERRCHFFLFQLTRPSLVVPVGRLFSDDCQSLPSRTHLNVRYLSSYRVGRSNFFWTKKNELNSEKKLNLILWKIPKKFGLNELN